MLFDKIKDYTNSYVYPFHMPGHKRTAVNPDLPYKLDMTEIEGFDNLHCPESCIKELEDKAAKLFGINRTFVLVNGATCGIMAAIGALTSRGNKVIVARNCHISVYRAVKLFGLKPEYVLPHTAENNIFGSVSVESVEKALKKNPDAKLVILTSPTYEGIVSDINGISEICGRFGAKLFVDEAHGAHFPFFEHFPKSAAGCGADVSVVSLHKTLPALTQTALLLTNQTELESKLQENLAVFQTSSPSYILMSSVDICLKYIEENPNSFEKYFGYLTDFEKKAYNLKNLKLLFRNENKSIFAYDRGKLVISTSGTNLSGIELAEILRNKYRLETEMASTEYIIAMTSVCDSEEGFGRLYNALFEIDKNCDKKKNQLTNSAIYQIPQKEFEPFECDNLPQNLLDINDCKGKISLEDVFAYPPGIPLLVRGEVADNRIINLIISLSKQGINVYSSQKNCPERLLVADL